MEFAKRVWIAMALCQGTKTLFLDEPTTYLDIRYQIEILQLVKKLNQEFGITEESIRELYGIEFGVTRVDGQKFVLSV